MTRSELIEQVSSANNVTIAVATDIVQEIFDGMSETLVASNRIEIRGFGSFEIRDYDGYTARNPKTGEEVDVKPKKAPFFKAGREMKERLMAD